MSSSAEILPSSAHLQALITYLKGISKQPAQRGSALHTCGAVKQLWWRTEDKILCAEVQGTRRYTQTIHFNGRSVFTAACTCPIGGNCKHVVAALLSYSKGWSGPGANLKNKDRGYEDYRDADDDEGDENEHEDEAPNDFQNENDVQQKAVKAILASAALASAAITAAKNSTSQRPPTISTSTPDQNILANALATRFGHRLTAAEKKSAALIDQLYQRGTSTAPSDLLFAIAGQTPSYYFRYYAAPTQIWPAHRPPTTIIEAWLYLAHVLKNLPNVTLGPLFSKVPWPEVDRLIAPWLREKAIVAWQEKLTDFTRLPDHPPPRRAGPSGGHRPRRGPGDHGALPDRSRGAAEGGQGTGHRRRPGRA